MPSSVSTPSAAQVRPRPRRLIRLAIVLAVALAALAGILPWAAKEAIGPVRLRSLAEDALSDAVGRKVTILGDVSIIVAPWFGLSIGPLAVADAPGFGPSPMLGAARTEVTIRILPLLAKVVSPGSIRVKGLAVHLRRDASGRANWDDLTAPQASTPQAAPGWQVAPQPRDVRVEDATVTYQDDASGRSYALRGVRLSTGVGQPFGFSLSFAAEGALADASLECHAKGQASFDPDSGRLAVHKALVESALTFSRPVAPGGAAPLFVVSRATVDYDGAGRLDVSDLDARVLGARLTGTASVTDLLGSPRTETTLRLTADMAGKWRELLGLTPADAPESLVAPPSGQPVAQAPAEAPVQAQPVVAQDESLSAPEAPQAGQAEMTLTASADAASLTLRALRLRLPRGTFTAMGSYVFGQTPGLDISASAEDMDFDALPQLAGRASWPMPAAWLNRLAVDARLDLRRCVLAGQAVTDAHATVLGRGGDLRLYPASALLPAGLASLDVRLGVVADGLSLDARAEIHPNPGAGFAPAAATKARLIGRLEAGGAKGNCILQSPDPDAAARVLGLPPTGLPAAPLEGRGTFTVTPGTARPVERASLTDVEAKFAGTTVRGQIAWNAGSPAKWSFDLAADALDLEKLPAAGAAAGGAVGTADEPKAEGKLRVERLDVRGVQAKDALVSLVLGQGRFEAALAGGELFGGKLSGRAEGEASGRLTAALQLTGADASRLPGGLGLSGPVSVKANLETFGAAKTTLWRNLQATAELEASQLAQGQGADKLALAGPRAVLTVKGRDAPAGEDAQFDATLTATCQAAGNLRDVRASAAGILAMDKAGRVKESGPAKLEASATWRAGQEGGRPVKVSVSGPLSLDPAGGFSTGDLRCDVGSLSGTAKAWRKAGENSPLEFSLDTGLLSPRLVLASWGVTLPQDLPADRLTKGSLAAVGAMDAAGCDVKRLTLVLDDSTLTGRASFPKLEMRHGKWDLSLDRLDCDAYSPPETGAAKPPADRKKPLDLRFLRELGLDARLAVGWFKKGNVIFDNAVLSANARGGQFTFRQESPRFYGGRFFAEVRGDARDVVLKTFIELKLEGFECARFLKDWAEGNTLDSGGATFILAAKTSGISEAELRGNLSGSARLQITRGSLKVRDTSVKPGEPPRYDSIPFDVFSSSWIAKEGVAHSDDFLIDGPTMKVAGKGIVDLRDETIDLSVMAALASGGQVPATIIGPLDEPKLTIDRSKMIGDMVYRVLQGIVSIPGKAVTRILRVR